MNNLTQLKSANGLRIVHLRTPGSPVGYAGLAIRAGSRDEREDEYGLAHFVEHTIFKGTERRTAWHILNRLDGVGGELNAFTTKEDTVVYASFPRSYNARAVELIADLAINSQFPERELLKERDVVEDEILSYLDIPADAVYDNFEDILFRGTGLGHNILGNVESLKTFTSAKSREWLQRYYTADNCVFFYAGAASPEVILGMVDRYFAAMPKQSAKQVPAQEYTPDKALFFNTVQQLPIHQAHTVMGAAISPAKGDAAIAFSLAVNVLGGPGMNSLLNVELRERRGLVYTVEASVSRYLDASLMAVYFGCDADDNNRCKDLVIKVLDSFAENPMTPVRLRAAKRQFLGQNTLASVNTENRIIALARAICMGRRLYTPKELTATVSAVSAEDLCRTAQSLLPLSSLTLAP